MIFFLPGVTGFFALGIFILCFSWLLNAIIVRTPLFPVLFHTPRIEYQEKKRIRRIKQQVLCTIRRMTAQERENTDWDAYACTIEEETQGAMSRNELYRFIYRTMHKMSR